MPIFQIGKAEAELCVSDTVLLCKLQSGLWLISSSMLLYPNRQYALSDHVVLQGLRAEFLAASKSLFMSLFDNREALFFCPFLPDLVLNNPTIALPPPPALCGSQWYLLFFWSLPGVDQWCGKELFLWHPEGFSNRSPLLKFKTPDYLAPTLITERRGSGDVGMLLHSVFHLNLMPWLPLYIVQIILNLLPASYSPLQCGMLTFYRPEKYLCGAGGAKYNMPANKQPIRKWPWPSSISFISEFHFFSLFTVSKPQNLSQPLQNMAEFEDKQRTFWP